MALSEAVTHIPSDENRSHNHVACSESVWIRSEWISRRQRLRGALGDLSHLTFSMGQTKVSSVCHRAESPRLRDVDNLPAMLASTLTISVMVALCPCYSRKIQARHIHLMIRIQSGGDWDVADATRVHIVMRWICDCLMGSNQRFGFILPKYRDNTYVHTEPPCGSARSSPANCMRVLNAPANA